MRVLASLQPPWPAAGCVPLDLNAVSGLQSVWRKDQPHRPGFDELQCRTRDLVEHASSVASVCDEAKPACSYCVARHVPCQQPESQFDVAWRPQNEVASRGVQRRLKARDNVSGDTGSPGSEPGRSTPDIVPRVLRQDHENYAVSFFFDNYLLPRDPAVQNGFLECVYPVWTQAAPTSPLRPAVLAVALCLLEAWSFVNPNSPDSLARPYYLQGLAAVRQRLENSGEISDDLIMAPLMLEMYDAVTAFCGSRIHVAPHITGTRALIKGRRKPLFDNETSQRILLGLRGYIVGRAIRSKETVADDVSTWGTITQNVLKTEAHQLEELDIEVANLQASIPNPLNDPGTSSLLVSGALADAQDLDQRLTDWANAIPNDWNPTVVSGPECIPETVRNVGLYQPYCHIYRSIQVANTLNGYRCSRLKLQLMILDCLNHLKAHQTPSTSSSAASQNIQQMAGNICASVPFFLGDRVHPHRLDDKTVQYPHLEGQPVPREHYSAAGAYAGIFLTQRLGQLLQPGLPLREGQRQWALGQMLRVKRVYRVQAEPSP